MGKVAIFEDDEVREKWFPYDDDTEVLLAYIDRQGLQKINTKTIKAGKLTGTAQADYSNCLLGHKAVKGWRKIKDHDHPGLIVKGQPLPFSLENIDLLMTKSLEFSRFVNERCTDAELFDIEDEEEPKNA